MKKLVTFLMCVVLLLFASVGCDTGESNPKQPVPSDADSLIEWVAQKKIETDQLTMDVNIPKIAKDGLGAESINAQISSLFYTDDVKAALNNGFLGIQLKIITEYTLNDEILSIRVTRTEYPSYGTDGVVYSVCYDTSQDVLQEPGHILSEAGFDYTKVMKDMQEAYMAEYGRAPESFAPAQVFINAEGEIELASYVIDNPPGGDPWKIIYKYNVTRQNED